MRFTTTALTGVLPAATAKRRRAQCVSAGQPVGVARDGAPLLAPFDARGRDLVARGGLDACGGRRDGAGRYAYRAAPLCLDGGSRRAHSQLLGYARDGFGLFGPRGSAGRRVARRDLDACGGHVHRIRFHGRWRSTYHYHASSAFPHTLGCFRGRPARGWRLRVPATDATVPGATAPAPDPPASSPPAPPPTRLELSAAPGLQPAYAASVPNYVTRCDATTLVRVDVDASPDVSVAIDGAAARSGAFSATVALTPGQAFAFTVTRPSGATTHHVRCLPADFPAYTATADGTAQAEYYLTNPFKTFPVRAYAVVFDRHGAPVWWKRAPSVGPFDVQALANGRLGWFAAPADGQPMAFQESALDGSLVRTTATVGVPTDFHEHVEGADGHRFLLSYPRRDHVDVSTYTGKPADTDASVLDGVVQELDAAGKLIWEWSSVGRIGLAETDRWWQSPDLNFASPTAYDVVHANSIEDDGDAVLVSMRHNDAVYRIVKATGAIDWKLGGTTTPESLTIIGDDGVTAHLGGQHDARRLPDGSVTVHDNGTGLNRPPRALRFVVDRIARTATLVEQVIDPDPAIASSFCCGSSRRLPGGNWVMAWGGTRTITELTPSGGRPFRVDFPADHLTYRAQPVLPGVLSAAALRAGMNAQFPR